MYGITLSDLYLDPFGEGGKVETQAAVVSLLPLSSSARTGASPLMLATAMTRSP